ncbi:hypothetical protein ILYODFUR_002834 [Ilyodon furcidens]|uniref:Uncharacterized protein n=1 Tax=Ilyodon furcidens TaxID=33524 RepID=A0ABV0SIW2_9TELE
MHYPLSIVCHPSLQCHSCVFSFLPHSPFILDLLSWWWWVSLYNMELGVENTKAEVGQILHAAQITLEDFSLLCCSLMLHHKFCCVPLLEPHVSPESSQSTRSPFNPRPARSYTQTHTVFFPFSYLVISVPVKQHLYRNHTTFLVSLKDFMFSFIV